MVDVRCQWACELTNRNTISDLTCLIKSHQSCRQQAKEVKRRLNTTVVVFSDREGCQASSTHMSCNMLYPAQKVEYPYLHAPIGGTTGG